MNLNKSIVTASVVSSTLLVSAAMAASSNAAHDKVRYLFVGNSLTYYNDLPQMVRAVRTSIDPAIDVEVDMLATGGATLMDRIADNRLRDVVNSGGFDIVVLQDRGGYPLCADADKECSLSNEAIARAVKIVREAGAEPVLFSTWQQLPAAQVALSRATSDSAHVLGIRVADVGAAMAATRETDSGIPLWEADGHPAVLGSWVAAVTIVRAQMDKDLPVFTIQPMCRSLWQGS